MQYTPRRVMTAVARRLLYKFHGPRYAGPTVARLSAEHLDGAKLLPDRAALASKLKGVGAEVGVAFGDFSELLLKNSELLYLIDAWEAPDYQAGHKIVQDKFRTHVEQGKARILKGQSVARISDIPDASLDYCYIDSDHSYPTTAAELEAILPKMKPDGRIAGDDYSPGNANAGHPYGVIPAVQDFCVRHGWKFEYLTMEYDKHNSFCLRRIATS